MNIRSDSHCIADWFGPIISLPLPNYTLRSASLILSCSVRLIFFSTQSWHDYLYFYRRLVTIPHTRKPHAIPSEPHRFDTTNAARSMNRFLPHQTISKWQWSCVEYMWTVCTLWFTLTSPLPWDKTLVFVTRIRAYTHTCCTSYLPPSLFDVFTFIYLPSTVMCVRGCVLRHAAFASFAAQKLIISSSECFHVRAPQTCAITYRMKMIQTVAYFSLLSE